MNCPHCNIHVDVHEASRCLDAWVADVVMELPNVGYYKRRSCFEGGWVPAVDENDYTDDCPEWKASLYYYNPLTGFHRAIPRYSGDISDAWRIVSVVIDPTEDEFDVHFVDGWIATFSIVCRGVHSSMAPFSAPLAICRAAIKAVKE